MMIKLVKITHNSKRKGRGLASGKGKTAGRGTKGQKSRSGKKQYQGFTTGSVPLYMRLPKFDGIKSKTKTYAITTSQIERLFKPAELITRAKLVTGKLVPKSINSSLNIKIVLSEKQSYPYKLDRDIAKSKSIQTTKQSAIT